MLSTGYCGNLHKIPLPDAPVRMGIDENMVNGAVDVVGHDNTDHEMRMTTLMTMTNSETQKRRGQRQQKKEVGENEEGGNKDDKERAGKDNDMTQQ